jgi:hypothetical protein
MVTMCSPQPSDPPGSKPTNEQKHQTDQPISPASRWTDPPPSQPTHQPTTKPLPLQGQALKRIPGLGEDLLTLVWTMADRQDPESDYAPFWGALPTAFGTGASPARRTGRLQGCSLRHSRFLSVRVFTSTLPPVRVSVCSTAVLELLHVFATGCWYEGVFRKGLPGTYARMRWEQSTIAASS